MRVLILCTGNSCRSQMAAGFLASFDDRIEVHSAGTYPAARVHPMAIEVMKEAGVDISLSSPKSVEVYVDQEFDFIITVCDDAREACPVFTGKVGRRVHMGFQDPSFSFGTAAHRRTVFRRVRDEIREGFDSFYKKEILPLLPAVHSPAT